MLAFDLKHCCSGFVSYYQQSGCAFYLYFIIFICIDFFLYDLL